ncbi:xanthine/uracil/vitamin C permease [Sulfolobus acidocaldarius SUSAZ]|nr:xanthine/uracil/vitamin C permease [Sulfolobus acidocaldarius SUSAZ]
MSVTGFFELKARNTNLKTETIAGITTFLAMAYILFVNPSILTGGFELALRTSLGLSPTAPIPAEYQSLDNVIRIGFTVATATAAAVATLIMALFGKMPFGLAPGMGENAFIAYTVIPSFTNVLITSHYMQGESAAVFAVYLSLISVFFNGILFLIFSVGGIREFIINSVPETLRIGIGIGIGLFISLIGLADIGIVEPGQGTPIQLNTALLSQGAFYLGLISFFIAAALLIARVIGGFIIAIIATTVVGGVMGYVSLPPAILTVPDFATSIVPNLSTSFYLYFVLFGLGFPIAFSLFLVDFFDGVGTISGLATKAGLIDEKGKIKNINRTLISDALASILAPFFGTSTTVIYVESATGIEQGGKSGLTALVISLLFFASIPLAPLFSVVPGFATGGVLVLVGLLFLSLAGKLVTNNDMTDTIPAFVTMISIPFTYSITAGIGLGFISYVVLKLAAGKFRDLKLGSIIITILFVIYFALLATGL